MSVNTIKRVFVCPKGVGVYSTKTLFRDAGYTIVDSPNEQFDAAVWVGGTDICPYVYGEKPITQTQSWDSDRDLEEIRFYKSLSPWTPKIGICRGAQLLNVLGGGTLVQDVDNHAIQGTHPIIFNGFTKDDPDETIEINSRHHQMMVPPDDITMMLGYATITSKRVTADKVQNINREKPESDDLIDPEILYIWTNNSLCFQAHPEDSHKPTRDLFLRCVEWLGRVPEKT